MISLYREAFNKTLQKYKITAKFLSEATGIQERQISMFKNNKSDLLTETFFKLVEGLPPNAKSYFLKKLQDNEPSSLVEMVEAADDNEIEMVLLAVGRKWKQEMQSRNSTESMNNAIAV